MSFLLQTAWTSHKPATYQQKSTTTVCKAISAKIGTFHNSTPRTPRSHHASNFTPSHLFLCTLHWHLINASWPGIGIEDGLEQHHTLCTRYTGDKHSEHQFFQAWPWSYQARRASETAIERESEDILTYKLDALEWWVYRFSVLPGCWSGGTLAPST